ncbi:molecular chaperone Hsp70 [Lentzea sp. NBRC 105346]|uniref:Hsp70 family protein n=1 Tax=Lentzea sp. NBRC 105346 TaxID=3032205 RepID=UPI0024A29F2E|nr:Hsp70 family protein [Lentzea sp. NBRC 105346]GLZ34250.1 molecular chaperone Hsp70 [Lentzea sp. NBRC 105346]
MTVLSVDLGTSTTVAVLTTPGQPPRPLESMPSGVYCAEDGTLVAGTRAEELGRDDPARYEATPKRRIDDGTIAFGDQVVPVTDVLAAILAHLMEKVREEPTEIRLTHPAQWGPTRRNVLLSAARLAGMSPDLVLVPEPVAIASYARLPAGQALAVFDYGAGTLDVSVVGATPAGFTVLADDGLADVGGLDVDQALLDHLGRQVAHQHPADWMKVLRPEDDDDRRTRAELKEAIRTAKEALSQHPQTELRMPEPFGAVTITRVELEALIRGDVSRGADLLASVIRTAGVTPAGVGLVGGASRTPLVAQMIAAKGLTPTLLDAPAAALGAHVVAKDTITLRAEDPAKKHVEPATVVTEPVKPDVSGSYQVPNPNVSGAHQMPSGPYSVSGTYPVTGPQQFHFPQQQAAPKKDNKKALIAIGAAVVLLLAVVGTVFALTRPNLPDAQDCKDNTTQDDKGFTPCLRQLAGAVPDGSTCESAQSAQVTGMDEIKGTVVTCQVRDGYAVQYILTETVTGASTNAEAVVKTFNTDRVEADWTGNGLEGQYRATADNGVGVLVFTVKDRPMFGILTKSDGENAELSADNVADFFEKTVQPGT